MTGNFLAPGAAVGSSILGHSSNIIYAGQLLLVHGIETLSLQLFSEGVVSVALKRFESGLCIVQQAQTLKQRTPFTNNGLDEHMPSQVLPQNSLGQSFIS